MALLLELHVTAVIPDIALPFWSRACADSWTVAPTFTDGVDGETATDVKTAGPDPWTTTDPDIPE